MPKRVYIIAIRRGNEHLSYEFVKAQDKYEAYKKGVELIGKRIDTHNLRVRVIGEERKLRRRLR